MTENLKKKKIAFVHQLPHPAHEVWAKSVGAKFMYFRGNKKLRERGNRHVLLNILRLKFVFSKPDVIISEGGAPLFPSVVLHNFSTGAKIILIMADETGLYAKANNDLYARDIRAFLSMIDGAVSVSSLTSNTFTGLVPENIPIRLVRPSIGKIFMEKGKGNPPYRKINRVAIVSKGGKRGLMNKIPRWLDECFHLMQKDIPDLEVAIAGTKESDLKFENIRYCGVIPYRDMPSFYSQTGVLFHFPDFDPFPVSLMEALALGCPVLTGKGTGNYEYFAQKKWTEMTCDENDPSLIAHKALKILSGNLSIERKKEFSDTVRRELSPENSALEFNSALGEILKK
ncbi:glycosyltransferase [candidate division WOR-3 bacterium]|nr:glycosyltransferase [candidate division WOR-3 bacterium]